ncbi:MAG: sigma-70 family RNA polymerase sigma factor [Desulfobacterium sp.]|nr:sigma-70 family RNA polymerase sigma factor [Desulfobacterium sp.]
MIIFADFYRDHKDRLLAYLLRMTGDYELSCDLMQESFTRCLERYGWKGLTSSLLFTVARNAVYDHGRRRQVRQRSDRKRCQGPDNPEEHHLLREEYQRVLTAMQQLEPDEKDLLSLAATSIYSYREIAQQAGISEANVKVKVHRARIKLKKLLGEGSHHG